MRARLSPLNQNRRNVLVVGMLDSVHLARWLSQFKSENIDFTIMGSKKFKHLHPMLVALIHSHYSASFKLAYKFPLKTFIGYVDFIKFVLPTKFFGLDLRVKFLSKILERNNYDYIHALEMQGAGYLISDLPNESLSGNKIIVTNWGSDIYFFRDHVEHVGKIRKTLARANYYSAECERDYKLAREFGFGGIELPCIPNAGGFAVSNYPNIIDAAERKIVVVKAYGGKFGLGKLAIDVMNDLLRTNPEIEVYFYSVTVDLIQAVEITSSKFPNRVNFSTTKHPISREELMTIFSLSRVFLGCSRSDGISTSFLEALLTGTYPVQTQSSCANEWIQKGAIGSIVPPDKEAILKEITKAIESDDLVRHAREANLGVSQSFLSEKVIQPIALSFYN